MTRPWPILCSECNAETGAWFMGGDPYLPCIYCTECAEKDQADPEGGGA